MLNMILESGDNVPTSAIVIGGIIILALIIGGTILMYLNPRKKRHL